MPSDSILGSCDAITFLVTTDYARARPFYRDVLGLRLLSEDRFALVFDANGIMLRMSAVGEIPTARHTVLGWKVTDISQTLAALERQGVRFEHYGLPNQDERGIWNAPGGAKVAWFKDPDGNTLSLTQFE